MTWTAPPPSFFYAFKTAIVKKLKSCYPLPVMKNLRFAIAYNPEIQNAHETQINLSQILKEKGIGADVLDIDNLKSEYDFVFVIGGDGTILKTARFYAKFQTPIFGINLGRLGFLSQSSKEELNDAVEKILNGKYILEDRIMLASGKYSALNDFVVKGSMCGRTSHFSLKINDKTVCNYLADGIIISTPTGSTAYGLSAGGPVLSPNLNAFVIIPICPHTLTARPIVVPDNAEIKICMHDGKDSYCIYADGQEFFEFCNEIKIYKSEYNAKLALLEGSEFYSVLNDKLHWGTSPVIKFQ